MFFASKFNEAIGNWEVANVKNMNGMFYDSNFNQPINKWCVRQIESEPENFSDLSPLTAENKPVWGTCPGPDTLYLLSPKNNSNGISIGTRTLFTWEKNARSTHYQIQLYEGENF